MTMTLPRTHGSRAAHGLRTAALAMAAVTTVGIGWTVVAHDTAFSSSRSSAVWSSTVGTPLAVRPAGVPDGSRAELHRYGAASVTSVTAQGGGIVIRKATAVTAEQLRYGRTGRP